MLDLRTLNLCIITGFSLVMTLGLGGCGAPEKKTLRIGTMEWSGFYPLSKAQEDGLFAKAGVSTQVLAYPDNPAVYAAFTRGDIDVCTGVWSDAIRLAGNGVDIQVIAATDWSDGGDVILSAKDLTTAAGLRGKKIACEGLHTFSHLFVLDFLAAQHLKETDVEIVDMAASAVPAGILAGTIDAGHTWGPLAKEASAKGCNTLEFAGQLPGSITQVMFVHTNKIAEARADLLQIVSCFYAAQPHNRSQAEGNRIAAAKILNKDPTSISPIGSEAHLLDRTEATRIMKSETDSDCLQVTGERIAKFYAQRGQVSAPVEVRKLINMTFIQVP